MSSPVSSTPAEAIASSEDLLLEILLRVPAKPLLKFKSVSKRWLSLISSSEFSRSHVHRHRDNGSLTAAALLFHCGSSHLPRSGFHIVPLNDQCSKVPFFDYLGPSAEIVQSCNGLLLCRSFDGSANLKYFVCNPITKKFRRVSFPQLDGFVYAVNLAFDPLKSACYKIIAIRRLLWVAPRFQIDIYSSETDSWNLKVVNITEINNVRFELGVFCNGAIHWDSKASTSLFLDVEDMSLKEMPMPAPMPSACPSTEYSRSLGESCGHLHLAIAYLPPCLQINIFEMAPDYSSWFLKYRVNLETVMKGFPEINLYSEEGHNQVHSLCVMPSEKAEASKVVAFVNWKAISYDLNDGTLTKLCYPERCPALGIPRYYYQVLGVFQYFETLAHV